MPDTVILADDLSGAADCGLACATAGHETIVVLGERPNEPPCRVLAIDADTRGRGRDAAAAETARLARLHAPATRLLFRKLDSTLRGHVAAELAAVLAVRREAGPATILLAAAFPATGRTTRDGVQLLDGVALQDTAVWRHERMTGTAFLPGMLAKAGLRTVVVGLEHVRAHGLQALVGRLAADREVDVLSCDAESDDDLACIAAAGFELGPSLVWAGSAGLAAGLARLLPRADPMASRPAAVPFGPVQGPVLFVVGSLSAVSARQVAALSALPGVEPLVVAPEVLRQGNGSAAWRRAEDALDRALGSGRDVVVSLAPEPDADPREGLELCHALARLAAPHAGRISALVSAGGETARAVLLAFGATGLRLHGQIEAGVPLALTEGGQAMPVVTKAGAFGRDDTLLRCRAVLHDGRLPLPAPIGAMSMNASSLPVAQVPALTPNLSLPVVAITMGDATGVGPEVIMKSLAYADLYERCRPLVIGDARRLEKAGRIVGASLAVRSIERIEDARFESGTVDCFDLHLIPEDLPFGKLSPIAGDAAFQYLRVATQLAVAGKVAVICTAPLNKEALHAGGHDYPGHTEMLAALTGTEEVSMMLTAPKLRVIHVTTHIGLMDAIRKIEPGLVERTITRGYGVLEKAGLERRRIGVCAINPHAGENGLFGQGEELEKIVPAVRACQAKGWDVEGPLPADTLFFRAGRGDFDMVVAMYHDQGHGPVKVLGLEAGVNITVGLPVIRTSVDHGTAFDIAGTGQADERSLLEALRQGIALAPKAAKNDLQGPN